MHNLNSMPAIRAAWPNLSLSQKADLMAKHSRLYRYDSIEHYCRTLEQMPYCSNRTRDCVRSLRSGNHAAAKEAQGIIEAMQDQGVFTQSARFVKPHYYGARPNISAVVAGHPKSMYKRRVPGASRSGPLTFYVDLVVSSGAAGITFKRGVAIMALVLAMRRFRPCSLYAFDGTDHSICHSNRSHIVPVIFYATAIEPTDLASACEMFTNSDIPFKPPREHATFRHKDAQLTWAWDMKPNSRLYKDGARRVLQMSPQDLFITGGYLDDRLMFDDTVAWVKRQVAIHNGLTEESMQDEAYVEGSVSY